MTIKDQRITVTVCTFKRTKLSEYESGLIINEDSLIIDSNGKPVKAPVWNYELQTYEGHIIFTL